MNGIPDLIREAMRVLEVDQAGLAKRLKRGQPTVSRWLSGEVKPDYESCLRLAQITGIPAITVLETAGLDPHLIPSSGETTAGSSHPRLAAFIAQIESAYYTMTAQEWEVREPAGRALFSVPSVDAKTRHVRPAKAPRGSVNPRSNPDDHGPDSMLESHYPRAYRPLALGVAHS